LQAECGPATDPDTPVPVGRPRASWAVYRVFVVENTPMAKGFGEVVARRDSERLATCLDLQGQVQTASE
jgi:hypothetical protein